MSELKAEVPPGLKNPAIIDTKQQVHDLSMTELLVFFQDLPKKSYWAQFLSEFAKFPDPTVETMCVGIEQGKYVMRYHPEWYKFLVRQEVIVVIEHECLHIYLHQIPRALEMLEAIPDPIEKKRYEAILNAAMDLAVNSMLKAHSENVMPASALLPSQFGLPELKSMEWYAHELAPRVKVISVEICVEGEEGEGGEGGGQGEGGKDPTPGEGGGSKPNGKIKITVSSGDKKLDSLLNEPHDLDAEKAKIPGQNLSDTLDTIERNVDTTAQEVADLLDKLDRGKGCGSVPGFVRERLDRLKMVSPVKWEQILLSMIMDAKNRSAEFKINALNYGRVTMGSELGMFGVDQDILMFRIFCGIDTSGSMGSEQLTYIVSVIQAFVKMETDIEVKVVEYDCAIHKRYILKRNGQVDVNVIGRGGTDFNPFYREAKLGTDPLGKRFEPDLVLNFTDGYAPPPTEEYRKLKVPDAWILTKHGAHPCPKPGRTIRLDF